MVACLISERSTLAALVNKNVGQSWSNRLGLTVTPIATGIWAAERPFIWSGIDVGGRSVIARLPRQNGEDLGRLLIHSPVQWTESLGSAIQEFGTVGAIIAPNYEHLKYIKEWSDIYPSAEIWACPGLPSRMPGVQWTREFNSDECNKPEGVEALWLNCEVNPFSGQPFFNEVVFYHQASKALFVTDAFWNYPSSDRPNFDAVTRTGDVHDCSRVPVDSTRLPSVPVPFGTSAWKFGMDKVYLPFYRRVMVGKGTRRERYEECVSKILSWDVELVVPCHGDIIRGRELCARVLKQHFLG